MADYAKAREVQFQLRNRLKGKARLAGIGLVETAAGYRVKVNLIDAGGEEIPTEIDGVDIEIEHMHQPVARRP